MKKLYLSLESRFIPVSVSSGSNKFISTDHTLPPPIIRRGWMLVHRITCTVNLGNHYGTICRLYKLANYSVCFLLFSFLSGLLVGYLSFRRMDKNSGRLPLFQFYFHRFWRWSNLIIFVMFYFEIKANSFLAISSMRAVNIFRIKSVK